MSRRAKADGTLPLLKRSEMGSPAWARGMNPEQLDAINHGAGPARLLAPAGSGKTRVVVHRIARLVEEGVDPSRILALTFSKKAGDEMSARVVALGISGCRVGTWHSFCHQVMREDRTKWADWDLRESTRIELKDVLGFRGLDWKGADVNRVARHISVCKANLFRPGSEEAIELALKTFGPRDGRLADQAHQRYDDRLAEKEIITFDDYLVNVAEHFEDEENRLQWAGRYDYVIQDEGQDENRAQKHLAFQLARDHRNYMIVGDVFQAIYGFRGSKPEYLARFEEEWSDAVTYWLPRNYRSGRTIVAAANGIIRRAKVDGHEPREMVAERLVDGAVNARVAENLDGEAHNFASWVSGKQLAGDAKYSDCCALFRTNAQSRALEEALLGARIPYQVVGGTSFYERKEVRDLLAYLRIGAGRGEADDVRRCINAPFRFLGAKFVERVMGAADRCDARGERVIWPELVREVADGERIQSRQRASAAEWAALVAEVESAVGACYAGATSEAVEAGRPSRLIEHVIERTRYLEWLRKEEGEETIETSSVSNVRELIRVADRFPNAAELLDYIDESVRASRRQREDKQAGGERVLLMNMHRSKGLEWPHVWVAGFNELVMPHMMGDPEEERRLAYVAATRARDSLVLSYVRTMVTRAGIRDAAPSRFLLDAGVPPDGPREAPPPSPAPGGETMPGGVPGPAAGHTAEVPS